VRVLGVDPGLTRCGFGVVDGGAGRSARCVAVDVVRTPADAELAQRLLVVAGAIEQWLDEYKAPITGTGCGGGLSSAATGASDLSGLNRTSPAAGGNYGQPRTHSG